MEPISLADALFTRTQQKVLGLLYGRPAETFYLNEIVRLAGVGKGTVNRELDRMLAAGLVVLTRVGNQNHYQANPECPVYEELQAIVRKTFGVTDVLRSALKLVDDAIDFAFVYGSIAKGSAGAKSDIDLLVITDKLAYAQLMELLHDAELSLGRTINPSVYDLAQFQLNWKQGNAFITKIMKQPKLWIKGNEGELQQAG